MPKAPKIDKNEVINLINSGLSYGEIANFFGCSRQYVGQIALTIDGRKPNSRGGASMPPEKRGRRNLAAKLTANAIKRGIIIPEPCEVCGVFGKDETGRTIVEAHHDNYRNPLKVRWLCRAHHQEWHKKNKASG